jgi:hypothetical protein
LIASIAELLPPAEHGKPPRLIFVPHDALCRVPFGALMADEPGSAPLLARYEVQVVNSLHVLRLTLDNATADVALAAEDALVVGYPTSDLPAVRLPWAPEDIAVGRLRGAEAEAGAVAARLGTTALIGPAATKTAVLAKLAAAPVVHIATHGFVNEGSGKTVLLLHGVDDGDGPTSSVAFLGEDELDPAQLQLSARLVVLPACHSGRGQQWTGAGRVGLGRALLACGAPTVLLSRWSLPDQKGAAVMRRFYELLADPVVHGGAMQGDAAALLRDAIMHVFPGELLRRRWMDWGALQVLGAGAIRLPAPTPRTLDQRVEVELATRLDELTVDQLQQLLAAKTESGDGRHISKDVEVEWMTRKARSLMEEHGCPEHEARTALGRCGGNERAASAMLGSPFGSVPAAVSAAAQGLPAECTVAVSGAARSELDGIYLRESDAAGSEVFRRIDPATSEFGAEHFRRDAASGWVLANAGGVRYSHATSKEEQAVLTGRPHPPAGSKDWATTGRLEDGDQDNFNVRHLLRTAELYESMRSTRVMLSFASADGGLHLACQLRTSLLESMAPRGWSQDQVGPDEETPTRPAQEAYIDHINLTSKPGTVTADGQTRNSHWAEFYLMGTLCAHTVVLIIDEEYDDSPWCAGELDAFRDNWRRARAFFSAEAAAGGAFPGSEFQLLVVYEQGAFGAEKLARLRARFE